MNPNDNHQKMLDRDLRDFPVPPPPAGLLEKIQAEIPSGKTLAGSSDPTARGPRRWPLRLAATIALAAVGATVAWQVVKSRQGQEFDRQAQEYRAPSGLDDGRLRSSVQPPPPPHPAAPKAVVGKEEPSPTAAAATSTPLTESSSAEDQAAAAQVGQPVAVPNSIPDAAFKEAGHRGGDLRDGVPSGVAGGIAGGVGSEDAAGVPPGVEGRVEGGVAGGVAGGSVSGNSSPAAPKPAGKVNEWLQKVEKDKRYSVAYDAIQLDGDGRGREVADRRDETSQPDTMIFRETPANRFVDTAEDRLSTFALDVDTGSYTLTRGYLDRGLLPPPAAIRVEEFVNAQTYDDPAPRRGDFALSAEGAPAAFYPGERTRLLRFSVKAREIDARDRKPAVLTFVVDVSGSMNQENRLGLVKRALGLLLDELGTDDRVGLVVYGTNGRVLLRHTRDLEEIRRAIAELRPEGSTNVEEGLRLAYDLADEGWRQGASNRILLCSDGVANVGVTGPESILSRIGSEARRGIALTTIGFGMGNYNDALMEQLADQGDGTYHYVDALAEARKVFVDNLTGTLETVAKEAKVQVEFDPRSVVRWRLLGYENRDVADRDFRNDRIDAGELGAGHQATALYEVRLRDGAAGSGGNERIATLRLRWKSVAGREVLEESKELRARDTERSWGAASANFHQAVLAGAFAEKLKETAAADDFGWRSLRREAALLGDEWRRSRSAEDLGAAIRRAAEIAGVRDDGDRREDRSDRDDRRRGDDEERPRNPRLDED